MWELGFRSENWDSLPNPAIKMYDLKLITKLWLVQCHRLRTDGFVLVFLLSSFTKLK